MTTRRRFTSDFKARVALEAELALVEGTFWRHDQAAEYTLTSPPKCPINQDQLTHRRGRQRV